MKILDFFLFLWVIFVLLDPDPDPATQTMRIHADPDPKPWLAHTERLDQGYLHPSIKHPETDMSWSGFEPATFSTSALSKSSSLYICYRIPIQYLNKITKFGTFYYFTCLSTVPYTLHKYKNMPRLPR
jgi:hypothetical protein